MPTPQRSRAQLARENRALRARLAEAERNLAALRSGAQQRESEGKLRALFNLIPVGVSILDAQHRMVFVNPALERILTMRYEQLVAGAYRTRRYLRPDGTPMPLEAFASTRVFTEQRAIYDVETGVVKEDGQVVWTSVSAVPVAFHDWHVIVVTTDITARKHAEQATRELLLRMQKLAAQVPGMIYEYKLRPDGSICFPYASPGIRTIYGVAPDAVREDATPVLQLRHPDDAEALTASILESARTLTPWRHEYRIRLPDGTERWIYGDANPERDADGGTLWHGFLTDITARKQDEATLHKALESLTRANNDMERHAHELHASDARLRAVIHEKEVLLKEIHHRVKNNLQVLMSLLRLQSRQVTDVQATAALRDSRQRIEVIALAHELLYRTNDMTVINAQIYLQQLSIQISQIYAVAPAHVRVSVLAAEIWLNLDQAVPCGLIVSELLANSLKYAFPDGRPGEIGVALRAVAPDMLALTVRDTGVGLAPSAALAQPTSLGMTLVHDLVRQLHGTAVIESGAGVTITITFPRNAATAPAAAL